MKLAEVSWPQVAALDRDRTVVVLPYAACEQHGPHLPFFTDALLATAVAERVEARLGDAMLLAPTQWLGASSHHLGFTGTLSAPVELHVRLITEPLRPLLTDGWRRLLVLNGHGGNVDTIHVAMRLLHEEFPAAQLMGISYWDTAADEIPALLSGPMKGVGHACEAETSMLLALRPELVRMEHRADCFRHLRPELEGLYVPFDMKTRTRDGVDGYPTAATAETGEAILAACVAGVERVVRGLALGAEWRD